MTVTMTQINALPTAPTTGATTHLSDHGVIAQALQQYIPNVISNNATIPTLAPLASPTFTGTVNLPSSVNFGTSSTANQALMAANTSGGVIWQTISVSMVTGAAALASPTFTGIPAAPTPTAGDNTTKIATTAFVLANSRAQNHSVTQTAASLTMAAGEDSVYCFTGSTASQTLTLPAISGNTGAQIRVKNKASVAVTVAAAGADTIMAAGGTSTAATASVASGAAINLINDGTNWIAV